MAQMVGWLGFWNCFNQRKIGKSVEFWATDLELGVAENEQKTWTWMVLSDVWCVLYFDIINSLRFGCAGCLLSGRGWRQIWIHMGSATKNGVKWIHHRRMRIEWEYIRMKKKTDWYEMVVNGLTSTKLVKHPLFGWDGLGWVLPWFYLYHELMLETQWTYHLGMICTSGGHKKSVET